MVKLAKTQSVNITRIFLFSFDFFHLPRSIFLYSMLYSCFLLHTSDLTWYLIIWQLFTNGLITVDFDKRYLEWRANIKNIITSSLVLLVSLNSHSHYLPTFVLLLPENLQEDLHSDHLTSFLFWGRAGVKYYRLQLLPHIRSQLATRIG